MITRDDIAQRLDALRGRREQTLANLNALTGAIEDCLYWLGTLDVPSDIAPEGEQVRNP